MGLVYMFNTLPNNMTVSINGGTIQYPIYANSMDNGDPPFYKPSANKQVRIGSPKSDKQIYSGINTFNILVYDNTTQINFEINVPEITNIDKDLIMYIFFNKIILCNTSGFTIASANSL